MHRARVGVLAEIEVTPVSWTVLGLGIKPMFGVFPRRLWVSRIPELNVCDVDYTTPRYTRRVPVALPACRVRDIGACPRAGGQAGMSILVIDDDPEIRSSVGMFLQARGHMVYEAADGFVGMRVLRREAVDIVITDVKMPGMDGFEVLRKVKRLSPDTEVIVMGVASFLRCDSVNCYRCGLLQVPVPESIPSFRLNLNS